MIVGENIRKCRKKQGLTQKELAEKLGVSYTVISQYERGIRYPKLETIKKIVDALNIPIKDIIDDDMLEIEKELSDERKVFHAVGKHFSESAEYALCLYDSLNPKNQNKTIGYMERLLDEEKEDWRELLKRTKIDTTPDKDEE